MTEFGNYCYLGKTCFFATLNKTIEKGFSRNYFCNLEVDNWIDKYWKKFSKIFSKTEYSTKCTFLFYQQSSQVSGHFSNCLHLAKKEK
jgi:hypothetical protein